MRYHIFAAGTNYNHTVFTETFRNKSRKKTSDILKRVLQSYFVQTCRNVVTCKCSANSLTGLYQYYVADAYAHALVYRSAFVSMNYQ